MRRTLLALLLGSLALGSVSAVYGAPDAVTERGQIIEGVYAQIAIAGIIVFAIVLAALIWILIRYREGSGFGRATYERHRENLKAELGWTVIPMILVLWIGFISFQALVQLDEEPLEEDPFMTVYIEGYQWFWQAKYETGEERMLTVAVLPGQNGDLSNSEKIVVPADVPVKYDVTGVDVIHSFYVRELFQTLDAVPGYHNELVASLPEGTYFTQCKQNCGNPGHAYMRAEIQALPLEEYNAWFEDAKAGAAAGLQQVIPVTVDASTISTNKAPLLSRGAEIVYQFANEGATSQEITVGNQTITLDPSGFDMISTRYEDVGPVTISASTAGDLEFEVVEPVSITIELGAFELLVNGVDTKDQALQLDAGTLYVIEAENTHNIPHNVFFGDYQGARGMPIAVSKTIGGGETDSFIYVASEVSAFDMWCDISGHYESGMYGDVVVQ